MLQSPTDILELALKEPRGIVVTTDDPDFLRRRLYLTLRNKREAGDTRFAHLMIREGARREDLIIAPKPHEEDI